MMKYIFYSKHIECIGLKLHVHGFIDNIYIYIYIYIYFIYTIFINKLSISLQFN